MQKSQRPVHSPLAWLGDDRLLLDDTSRFGLRRRVIARKGDYPAMTIYIPQAMEKANGAQVYWWMVEKDDGFIYLWIVWKDKHK